MQLAIARRMPSTASLDRLAADNRFRRYGSMQPQTVRQADVTGTEIEKLHARRDMLRSMKPEAVKQVIEFYNDLNFFEALALAKKEGRIIVPNDVHDRILTETKDEKYLNQNYPRWTGTFVIYEAPNKPFEEKIVFIFDDKIVEFTIPHQFRGKRNCALVVEHPDFELIALGNNTFEFKVLDSKIQLIKGFPKENGWHMPHTKITIPHGRKVQLSDETRYLLRIEDGSYGGLLVRNHDLNRLDVIANIWSSIIFVVALF